eukprot:11184266-Ditylum_brightwellii.AAC.1
MNSSIKKQEKPKIYQVKNKYSGSNDSTYYGPTLHKEEEITSSYSSSSLSAPPICPHKQY